MTELTALTVASARDGLRHKKFSAVELADEGIVVLGQVAKGVPASDLKVGMEMQLEIDTLYTDDEHEYVVYVWAPA